MKSKIRALLILTALCVILAAVYILIPSEKSAAESSAASPLLITDIPVGEITAMTLSNKRVTLGIINSPEGISAVPAAGKQLSAGEMRALVYHASRLKALRQITNMPLPGKTEIEKSPARFSLILKDKREYNFAILEKSPVSEDYALYSQEQELLFLISAADAQWFLGEEE